MGSEKFNQKSDRDLRSLGQLAPSTISALDETETPAVIESNHNRPTIIASKDKDGFQTHENTENTENIPHANSVDETAGPYQDIRAGVDDMQINTTSNNDGFVSNKNYRPPVNTPKLSTAAQAAAEAEEAGRARAAANNGQGLSRKDSALNPEAHKKDTKRRLSLEPKNMNSPANSPIAGMI